jgi:hypothetical protein
MDAYTIRYLLSVRQSAIRLHEESRSILRVANCLRPRENASIIATNDGMELRATAMILSAGQTSTTRE